MYFHTPDTIKLLASLGFRCEKPVRDKFSHPYSYDPILVMHKKATGKMSSAYSDRMQTWNLDKFNEVVKRVKGKATHYLDGWSADEYSWLLSAYFDKPLDVVTVVELCNQSSGYPVWYFAWQEVTQSERCKSCQLRKQKPEDGWCYMFREEPTTYCAQFKI